ncbi:unnamed protein product [Rhizophagus irregularis]|nr:unnamed protein product [Rhizophagus irregularis]
MLKNAELNKRTQTEADIIAGSFATNDSTSQDTTVQRPNKIRATQVTKPMDKIDNIFSFYAMDIDENSLPPHALSSEPMMNLTILQI